MRGQNVETFRLYEALETGTLPITFIKDKFSAWIDEEMELTSLYDWTNVECITTCPTKCPMTSDNGETVQEIVMTRWANWKQRIKESIENLL